MAEAEQRCWPYSALRSGGIIQTEKLYTGQQEAPGDAALGLYNYKARFYSTALGRFVSGDPVASQMRYAYAANNPLRFVDPAGYTIHIACGTDRECENGRDVEDYENAIVREWQQEGRYGNASEEWLRWLFNAYFLPAMENGFNGWQSATTFGVLLQDAGDFGNVGEDIVNSDSVRSTAQRFLYLDALLFGENGSDVWIGYSHGGSIVFRALKMVHELGELHRLPLGAVLIEPRIGKRAFLHTQILAHTRVTIWVDPDWSPFTGAFGLHGEVLGAHRFERDSCGGCSRNIVIIGLLKR